MDQKFMMISATAEEIPALQEAIIAQLAYLQANYMLLTPEGHENIKLLESFRCRLNIGIGPASQVVREGCKK
jgi:hypothetical protein